MSSSNHGESSDGELGADEPRTPLWLPLLGLCLFVSALVYVLVGQKSPPAGAAPAASASAEAASAPSTAP